MLRRRTGLVSAVAALVVLGLSGCDAYELSVEQEGGVNYLEASDVAPGDTVYFFGFAPQFFDFQLDPNGEFGVPLLDDDGNYVPAEEGQAWVDDFTSIVPAFLTAYPASNQWAIDADNDDLRCNSDPGLITRKNLGTGLYGPTNATADLEYCADAVEADFLLQGFNPFSGPFSNLTEDPTPVANGVARLDLSDAQNFCGVTIMAMKLPYTQSELELILSEEADVENLAEEYEIINNLVLFAAAANNADNTNSYFIECDDESGGSGGAAPASTTAPKLAKTGANVEWLMFAGVIALIGGASFLTISRRKRTA